MNKPTREQMRADLARAMGYSVIKSGTYFYLLDPHGSKEENADGYAVGSTCEAGAWMNAPAPFTNHADSYALMCWLAEDDARWKRFYSWLAVEALGCHHGDSPIAEARDLLTAGLAIKAEAAWRAITTIP